MTRQTSPFEEMTVAELAAAGLLRAENGVRISRHAVFVPADAYGRSRTIVVGSGTVIEPFAVIHGGTVLGECARVESHAIVGKPEQGYAVGRTYTGAGTTTAIGDGVVLRSGAAIYGGVEIADDVLVGHHTLLRAAVTVGKGSQLGHHLTVERGTQIGQDVRCSPGSHITSSCVLADRVFIGAGVLTINDKTLIWRCSDRTPLLVPPQFDYGAKVGTGCVVLSGVTVGRDALVGAGSVITRDVPPGALAYGNPARVRGGQSDER